MQPMNSKKRVLASKLFYSTLPLIKKVFMHGSDFRQGELSPFLYPTLLCVYFRGKMKMSGISDVLGQSRPLVTQQVEKLVSAGFIERSGNPDDRRIIEIDLTDQGREFAEELAEYWQKRGENRVAVLSDVEVDSFVESMETLKRLLEKIDAQGKSLPDGNAGETK